MRKVAELNGIETLFLINGQPYGLGISQSLGVEVGVQWTCLQQVELLCFISVFISSVFVCAHFTYGPCVNIAAVCVFWQGFLPLLQFLIVAITPFQNTYYKTWYLLWYRCLQLGLLIRLNIGPTHQKTQQLCPVLPMIDFSAHSAYLHPENPQTPSI